MVNDGWHECLAPGGRGEAARRDPVQGRGRAVRLRASGGEVAWRWNRSSPRFVREPQQLHARLLPAAARGLRGAAQGARHDARRRSIDAVKASGLRGRGGAGFPDRHEVAVRRQEVAEAEVHLLQRRRERAGHVQGPPADGAQPAPAHRGVRDRLLRHRVVGGLHLHPRRVPPRPAPPRGRDRRGVQGRVSRARTSSAPASTATSTCIAAPAPTRPARRPRSSSRSRASARSRASSRRFRPSRASTAARPR